MLALLLCVIYTTIGNLQLHNRLLQCTMYQAGHSDYGMADSV